MVLSAAPSAGSAWLSLQTPAMQQPGPEGWTAPSEPCVRHRRRVGTGSRQAQHCTQVGSWSGGFGYCQTTCTRVPGRCSSCATGRVSEAGGTENAGSGVTYVFTHWFLCSPFSMRGFGRWPPLPLSPPDIAIPAAVHRLVRHSPPVPPAQPSHPPQSGTQPLPVLQSAKPRGLRTPSAAPQAQLDGPALRRPIAACGSSVRRLPSSGKFRPGHSHFNPVLHI